LPSCSSCFELRRTAV